MNARVQAAMASELHNLSVVELQDIITRERLGVSWATGGIQRRRKTDIIREIVAARMQNAAPIETGTRERMGRTRAPSAPPRFHIDEEETVATATLKQQIKDLNEELKDIKKTLPPSNRSILMTGRAGGACFGWMVGVVTAAILQWAFFRRCADCNNANMVLML